MTKYQFNNTHCPETLALTPRLKAVHPACLDILYERGIQTAEAMEEFLFPSLTESIRACPSFLDTEPALEILEHAVRNKEPITVYQDYDVDGCTAGAIAVECLTVLGAEVHRYCNERAVDGFGICANGVDNMMSQYPATKVLLTVDNGISGIAGVARAKELGLKVVVTDHHEPGEALPVADAVIDPKRTDEPDAQYKDNCGAGVIWRIMLELYMRMGVSVEPVMKAVDLAALGTVADVVPLMGQNRAIVQEGLRLMNDGQRPFFRIVSELLELKTIDAQYSVAFRIAPMINAVSRMDEDVSVVGKLLLSEDEELLREGIIRLDEINQERKDETTREAEVAEAAIPEGFNEAAIIVRDAGFREGIVGIVAGRLMQEYNRPVIVLTQDRNGNWKGSCRSPEGFSMKAALDRCAKWLVSYGGHARAAGVTVRASDFEAFEKEFTQIANEAYPGRDFTKTVTIDAVFPSSAYTEQMVRELRILEPYGEGFPQPLFGLVDNVSDVRYMGAEKQHVKYLDETGLSIVQCSHGEEARARSCFPRKFVGHPQLNDWKGNISVQFISA